MKCNYCTKTFKPKHKNQKVCSEQCLLYLFDSLASKTRRLASIYARSLGYRSIGEVRFANNLKRSNIKFEYEKDSFTYQFKPQTYNPDFKVKGPIYLEYKGVLDYEECKKLLAIKACNPELDLRLVFEKPNNKLYRQKTRYFEWAERHGFKWYNFKDIKEIKKDLRRKK